MQKKTTSIVFDLLLVLSIACIVAQIILLVIHYPTLPETIPTHFNWKGEPDDYGSKKFLLLIFAIGLGATFLTLFILHKAKSLPINWPGKQFDENAIRRMGIRIGRICLLYMSLLFLQIIWWTIRITKGESDELGPVFTYVITGAGFAITIAVFWMLYKAGVHKKQQ